MSDRRQFLKASLTGSKFDTRIIHGDAWPNFKPMLVERGKRYRIVFPNTSGDQHPMHLRRHSFEVTRVGDHKTRGLVKDCINVMPLKTLAIGFVADNPGDSLPHCHQRLHMDCGSAQWVKYKA